MIVEVGEKDNKEIMGYENLAESRCSEKVRGKGGEEDRNCDVGLH